jgi:uncharacterized membrane protein
MVKKQVYHICQAIFFGALFLLGILYYYKHIELTWLWFMLLMVFSSVVNLVLRPKDALKLEFSGLGRFGKILETAITFLCSLAILISIVIFLYPNENLARVSFISFFACLFFLIILSGIAAYRAKRTALGNHPKIDSV